MDKTTRTMTENGKQTSCPCKTEDKPRPRCSLRLLAKRMLLLMCSLVLSLVVTEVLVRLFLPQWAPRTGTLTTFWKFDPHYGWSHVPGASGRFDSHGFETWVNINTKGFRGPEVDYSRSGKTRRVLFLGDSYLWGFGVNQDEMFTTLLERMVSDLEVVNLAVSGYSTDQELLLYQDEGHKYQADLVVILVAQNDLYGNMKTVESVTYGKPVFRMESDRLILCNQPVPKPSWIIYTAARWGSKSYLLTGLNRIREGRGGIFRGKESNSGQAVPADTEQARDDESGFPRKPADKLMVKLLLELKASVADKQGKGELLVVFGDLSVTHFRKISNHLAKHEISCLVLGDYMDGSDNSLHLPDDFHWNPSGHKLVAQVLSEFLERELDQVETASNP